MCWLGLTVELYASGCRGCVFVCVCIATSVRVFFFLPVQVSVCWGVFYVCHILLLMCFWVVFLIAYEYLHGAVTTVGGTEVQLFLYNSSTPVTQLTRTNPVAVPSLPPVLKHAHHTAPNSSQPFIYKVIWGEGIAGSAVCSDWMNVPATRSDSGWVLSVHPHAGFGISLCIPTPCMWVDCSLWCSQSWQIYTNTIWLWRQLCLGYSDLLWSVLKRPVTLAMSGLFV